MFFFRFIRVFEVFIGSKFWSWIGGGYLRCISGYFIFIGDFTVVEFFIWVIFIKDFRVYFDYLFFYKFY